MDRKEGITGMRIEKFVTGPIGTNTYIVSNDETKEAFVVDMGDCPSELVGHIKKSGYEVKALLLTHGHFDHILGVDRFAEEFSVPVYAHEEEKKLLEDAQLNSSAAYGAGYTYTKAQYVKDNEELKLAGTTVQVLYTPGHTIGGCCYYLPKEEVVFSGDTLFHTSIGRTDLPTGSTGQLVRSIREKLFVLPPKTKVYPGHMEETEIGYEEKYNPFL